MKNHYLRSFAFAAMAALMLASTGCKKDDNKDPEPEPQPCFVRVTQSGVRDAMPDVLTVKLGKDFSQNEVYCPSDGKNLLPYDDDNAIITECLTTTSFRYRKVIPVKIPGKGYSCPANALRFDASTSINVSEGDFETFSLTYTSADGKISFSKTVTVKVTK